MNPINDSSPFNSMALGIARGVFVHSLIYPLEVVKIRQQALFDNEPYYKTCWKIVQNEGIQAFYKGIFPKLANTCQKQIWVWPTITETPLILKRFGMNDFSQQALTGLFIAAIDCGISTPLERSKILSAFSGKTQFTFKDGWKGSGAHLLKLSVNWSSFLVAQKYLRERYQKTNNEKLPFSEVVKVGIQVALVVSIFSAPFDRWHTLKQVQNLKPRDYFSKNNPLKLYRGWPLSALSLIIHNIASVFVLDRLERK